jgi:hypothetical protein
MEVKDNKVEQNIYNTCNIKLLAYLGTHGSNL